MGIAKSIYEGVVQPSYKKTYPGRRQPCWSQQASDSRSRLVMESPREGRDRWQAQKTTCK